MPSLQDHIDDTLHKLGKPFVEVHQWLDELAPDFSGGLEHRDIRHNRQGVEEVRKRWGDEAAKAAELHILLDWANLINATQIPKDEQEAAALRKDIPNLLKAKQTAGARSLKTDAKEMTFFRAFYPMILAVLVGASAVLTANIYVGIVGGILCVALLALVRHWWTCVFGLLNVIAIIGGVAVCVIAISRALR